MAWEFSYQKKQKQKMNRLLKQGFSDTGKKEQDIVILEIKEAK